MGTTPEGGTKYAKGTKVDLLISDGLIDVPAVVGKPISDANRELSPLGLSILLNPDNGCTGNAVTAQSLAAGVHPQKSAITLTYCTGVVSPSP